ALEVRLRQAHKLEAVGRLAGGVAHEFNNLLTVMASNLALALLTTPPNDTRRECLRAAEGAAWRAADLTRQLLGFSRRAELRPGPGPGGGRRRGPGARLLAGVPQPPRPGRLLRRLPAAARRGGGGGGIPQRASVGAAH